MAKHPTLAGISGHFREDRPHPLSILLRGMPQDLSQLAARIDVMIEQHIANAASEPDYASRILAKVEAMRQANRFPKGRPPRFGPVDPVAVETLADLGYLERTGVIGGEYNGLVFLAAPSPSQLQRVFRSASLAFTAAPDVVWDSLRRDCRLGRIETRGGPIAIAMEDCDVYDFGDLLSQDRKDDGYIGDDAYNLLVAEAEADPPGMPSERCAFILRTGLTRPTHIEAIQVCVVQQIENGIEWTPYVRFAGQMRSAWRKGETIRDTAAADMRNPIPVGLTLLGRQGPEVVVATAAREARQRRWTRNERRQFARVQVLKVNKLRLIHALGEAQNERLRMLRAKPRGYRVREFWNRSKLGKPFKVRAHDRAGGPQSPRIFSVQLDTIIRP